MGVEGHYQNAYLIAERSFSATAPTAALVRQVLDAVTPHDVLGVPEGLSMRANHRRWLALTKALGQLEDPEGVAAFKRVRVALDAIRAARPKAEAEDAAVVAQSED